MKQVVRNIDVESAVDLLEGKARACIAFANEDGPQAQPVRLVWRERRYFIGVPGAAGQQPHAGQEVVLLVDEGVDFFDLRALYVRGQLQAAEMPTEAVAGQSWFEVVPDKTVAWDYGSMREVDDGS